MSTTQAKLAQLHRHAEVMLDSVLNNPNITEESVKAMAQHERCAFQVYTHEALLGHQHGFRECPHCCPYIRARLSVLSAETHDCRTCLLL